MTTLQTHHFCEFYVIEKQTRSVMFLHMESIWLLFCYMGFLEFFEKTIGPIHFMPGIYPHRVSLLAPIHFRVPSLISALWWQNIWSKIGFPELFEENYWFHSLHTGHLPLWGESLGPYSFWCSQPHFRPKMGFLKLSENNYQNRNRYWIFLDGVGSDQSGVYPHLWSQLVLCYFHISNIHSSGRPIFHNAIGVLYISMTNLACVPKCAII